MSELNGHAVVISPQVAKLRRLARLEWAANEVLASEKTRGPNASYPPAFCLVSAVSLGRLERALTGEDEPCQEGNGLRHDFIIIDDPLNTTHEGLRTPFLAPALEAGKVQFYRALTGSLDKIAERYKHGCGPHGCNDCRTPPPDTCEQVAEKRRRQRDDAREERDEARKELHAAKVEIACLRRELNKCRWNGQPRVMADKVAHDQRISAAVGLLPANSKATREDVIAALNKLEAERECERLRAENETLRRNRERSQQASRIWNEAAVLQMREKDEALKVAERLQEQVREAEKAEAKAHEEAEQLRAANQALRDEVDRETEKRRQLQAEVATWKDRLKALATVAGWVKNQPIAGSYWARVDLVNYDALHAAAEEAQSLLETS